MPQSSIPECLLEHRHVYAESWVDKWTIPNPFISPLLGTLRTVKVELTDFSFNKDAANISEISLNVAIRKLNAAVRIGLDMVTFIVSNPDWGMVPQLLPVIDAISQALHDVVHAKPKSQETTLAFHVTPGTADFGASTALLVNQRLVGESLFYGISLHRTDGALIIDKSLRYEGAAFVRIQRRFSGNVPFSEVASKMYEDEVSALGLLGLAGVIV